MYYSTIFCELIKLIYDIFHSVVYHVHSFSLWHSGALLYIVLYIYYYFERKNPKEWSNKYENLILFSSIVGLGAAHKLQVKQKSIKNSPTRSHINKSIRQVTINLANYYHFYDIFHCKSFQHSAWNYNDNNYRELCDCHNHKA